MHNHFLPAPPLQTRHWLNTAAPIQLDALRGRVVVLHAFQMLCPACVSHGLPQATAIHKAFAGSGVSVIGLHTVFEHHAVMTEAALHAFVHEYRLAFPIGIDAPGAGGGVPLTMQAYGLRGTPSLVLIDKAGRLRLNHFGHLDDLRLGSLIGGLVAEEMPRYGAGDSAGDAGPDLAGHTSPATAPQPCDANGCALAGQR